MLPAPTDFLSERFSYLIEDVLFKGDLLEGEFTEFEFSYPLDLLVNHEPALQKEMVAAVCAGATVTLENGENDTITIKVRLEGPWPVKN